MAEVILTRRKSTFASLPRQTLAGLAILMASIIASQHCDAQPMAEQGMRWPINQGDAGPVQIRLGAEAVTDMSRTDVQVLLSSNLFAVRNQLAAGNLWFDVTLDPNPNATYNGASWDGVSSACWRNGSCKLAKAWAHWERHGPPETMEVRRISEIDLDFSTGCGGTIYCWHNCATPGDHCSPDARYSFDASTIILHEAMHGVVGCGHYEPCDPNTIMFPTAALNCHQQYLGWIDAEYAEGTLEGLDGDVNEPENDFLAGADDLGQLWPDPDYSELNDWTNRLPGSVDVDWFSFQVAGYVDGWRLAIYLYPLSNESANLEGTVFLDDTLLGRFDGQGAGAIESTEFPAENGNWVLRVCTPGEPIAGRDDAFVYSRAPNPYRVRIWLYRPVVDVAEDRLSDDAVHLAVSPLTGAISGGRCERDGQVTMHDASGREVWSRSIPARGDWSYRVSDVPSGIYFVRLAAGPEVTLHDRLVVVR